jgi:hypothetical protein
MSQRRRRPSARRPRGHLSGDAAGGAGGPDGRAMGGAGAAAAGQQASPWWYGCDGMVTAGARAPPARGRARSCAGPRPRRPRARLHVLATIAPRALGTRQRSAHRRQGVRQGAGLERSVKNRAENVMIVDLVRNDLSPVLAETGGEGRGYGLRLVAQEGCLGVVEFLPPRGVVDRCDGSGAR